MKKALVVVIGMYTLSLFPNEGTFMYYSAKKNNNKKDSEKAVHSLHSKKPKGCYIY